MEIVGDPTLMKAKVLLKAMLRCLREEGGGYWVECNRLETLEGNEEKIKENISRIPKFLSPTIYKFQQVFKTPVGLPPEKGHEHAIKLKQGSNPIGFGPYRYQKVKKMK